MILNGERIGLRIFLALLSILLVVLSGCTEPYATRMASRAFRPVNAFDKRHGDPHALASMITVAVLPFENLTGEESFAPYALSQRLASQLASNGEVRVIFPRSIMDYADRENIQIRQFNNDLRKNMLLGKSAVADRTQRMEAREQVASEVNRKKELIDPVRVMADAIKIGRMAGADAIVMGRVTDYNPYYRPRLGVHARLIATGQNDTAAIALAQMSQWGVPHSLNSHRGVIWERQQVFDARDGGTARQVYLFARTHHTEDRPFDTEVYLHSMDRFFEFVGAIISNELLDAKESAIEEIAARAEEEARRKGMEQATVQHRLRRIMFPHPSLPDNETVAAKNIRDRRDYSWTKESYTQEEPDRSRTTPAPAPNGVLTW